MSQIGSIRLFSDCAVRIYFSLTNVGVICTKSLTVYMCMYVLQTEHKPSTWCLYVATQELLVTTVCVLTVVKQQACYMTVGLVGSTMHSYQEWDTGSVSSVLLKVEF